MARTRLVRSPARQPRHAAYPTLRIRAGTFGCGHSLISASPIRGPEIRRHTIHKPNKAEQASDGDGAVQDGAPGPPSSTELRFPTGSLVLVAGLPGAGKSTLLERLYGLRGDETLPVPAGDVRVIDSRQSRNWWGQYLGPVPPRARVPLVHSTHIWRIARAVLQGHDVVAHTRGTWPHILPGFAWLAGRRGARVHLVLIDVAPGTARAGQYERGRVLTAVAFRRHCRRWRPVIEQARRGAYPPAATVTVLDRAAADLLKAIRFENDPPGRDTVSGGW
jgi:energy-coupling factor transporter ATP-binding protein EcfA2